MVFSFLYNFCSTLSYAPRTSGAKWLFLPFKFLDLPLGPVLSTELLVCTCSSTSKDVTGPVIILCHGWVRHLGGHIRWEIYFCRSLILVWTTFLSEAAPSGCLSRSGYTPLGKLLQKEISFPMGKPKQFHYIQKQVSLQQRHNCHLTDNIWHYQRLVNRECNSKSLIKQRVTHRISVTRWFRPWWLSLQN